MHKIPFIVAVLACNLHSAALAQSAAQYIRSGNPSDKVVQPLAGFSLQGGGENDEAFRYLCREANGGDILVLRATGDDEYNRSIRSLCPSANSIATLILPTRKAASEPIVTDAIRHAECIFLSGGDQANYIRNWKGTPVQMEINHAIARGVPVGGTSAGLAVLGEFAFSALNDSTTSEIALSNPYDKTVTLDRGFLNIALLRDTMTDTHFVKRDRMGRLLVFMARILKAHPGITLHAIAVDEDGAVALAPDGSLHLLGAPSAYLLSAHTHTTLCRAGKPLTVGPIQVYRMQISTSFNVKSWSGTNGTAYELRVENGKVLSTQAGNSIY